ncbi:N-acetylneuraminate lyase-like isoform X1 [Penaeus monodon]|uniref:N-acetylneuraminate lyase-like isoform X1 n=2 Tax=Penaeus monodon TaxID=6687 RepID=UPI0018A72EA9|nr:N-acetylneuraminate lyase-like isoform X1 [Penaeus monodon]
MAKFSFHGLMAPTFAPFHSDGSLNLDVIPAYAKHLRNTGVTGVWVNGTAGEGMSMTVAERKKLAEAWMACKKDVGTVIIQCGAGCLLDTQELARHAESLGACGIAVFPCIFDKPRSADELVDYMAEVAKACPGSPLFYYHIPMKTQVNLSMSEFLQKGVERIPTLAGLKFTDGDVSGEGKKCLEVAGRSLTIFNGFDERLQEAVSQGFSCGVNVCYNFCAHHAADILSLMKAGKVEEAKEAQKAIVDLLGVIFKPTGGFSVAGVKAAMTILTGLDVGPSRLPVKPLTPAMQEALRADLAARGMMK